jgi:ubiquinone/menaquinone biosynthesis C-methylase UbiE
VLVFLLLIEDIDTTLHQVRHLLKPDGVFLFLEHVAAEDGTFLLTIQKLIRPIWGIAGKFCLLGHPSP